MPNSTLRRSPGPVRLPPAPSAARTHPARIVAPALFLAALFVTPIVLPPTQLESYYLALLLTGLTLLPLLVRAAAGTLDVFEPIVPISLLIGLAFGLRAMYLAYAPTSILPMDVGLLRFADFIDRGLLLTIGAYCALVVGYYLVGGVLRPKPFAELFQRTARPTQLSGGKFAIVMTVAAAATFLMTPPQPDDASATSNVITVLAGLVQVSGCILALHIAAGDPRRWLRFTLWGVALPLAVAQSLLAMSKTPLLLMLFVLIAAHHYSRRRVRIAQLSAAVVVITLIIFPTINTLRFQGSTVRSLNVTFTQPGVAELVERVAALPATLGQMSGSEYLQLAAESVIARFTGIDALSLLLKYDVSAELGSVASYAYIPVYAFIPRAVWPDKPVLEKGTEIGRLLLDPTFEGVTWSSSFGIFHIGDLFLTFGVIGALVGMVILGCFYRLIYTFLTPLNPGSLTARFFYIFLLWHAVNGFQSDIPSIYSNLLKSLVIWFLVNRWVNTATGREIGRPSYAAARPVDRRIPVRGAATYGGAARPGIAR